MLNLKKIDNKFYIGGGWSHYDQDAIVLLKCKIGLVIDLEGTPDDQDSTWYNSATRSIFSVLDKYGIKYVDIPMFDGPQDNLAEIYSAGYGAIKYHFEKETSRVLIKCGVGVSRSPSMLIYYYMKEGLNFYEAREKIYKAGGLPPSLAKEFEEFLK